MYLWVRTHDDMQYITGDLSSGFLPCTPNGCIKLIEKSGVKVGTGKGDEILVRKIQ